jgi:hypothetical protein
MQDNQEKDTSKDDVQRKYKRIQKEKILPEAWMFVLCVAQ